MTLNPQMQNLDDSSQLLQPKFELIRFDRKVKLYLAACVILYVFFVAFKLHNSSIGAWNANVDDGGGVDRGVVAGRPLAIRSDEWLVVSSFILSQEQQHFPDSNLAVGYGKSTILVGLPTKNFLSVIKPALWGYYILDKERGFSWHWGFKVFGFMVISFLFLMLFTKNQFNLSVFGSIWLFLSSAIQWWSISTEIFFPAHWDPKLRIPRGQVVAAASIVSPKY